VRKLLFECPDFKPVNMNEKLKIIFDNHYNMLKKRDEFNKNRDKNLKKDWI
jgi:phosphate uptake regulator